MKIENVSGELLTGVVRVEDATEEMTNEKRTLVVLTYVRLQPGVSREAAANVLVAQATARYRPVGATTFLTWCDTYVGSCGSPQVITDELRVTQSSTLQGGGVRSLSFLSAVHIIATLRRDMKVPEIVAVLLKGDAICTELNTFKKAE